MGKLFIGTSQSGRKVVIKETKCLGDDEDPVKIEKLKVFHLTNCKININGAKTCLAKSYAVEGKVR